MIVVHFFRSPNGLKIAIMLEESGLPYRLEHVNILRGEQFAAEFMRISPNNKMPAIVGGQTASTVAAREQERSTS